MSFPSSPMDISFYQQLQLSPPASPTQGHHPAALCYYPAAYPSPPPFATDDGFHHIPEAHAAVMTDYPSPSPPPPQPKADGGERVVVARKDRHSKICTAGGMRDRRMRLSLDVARRFFALQDKLGFDKASKTVQWLLDMSRAGIKELMMTEDGSSLSDTTKQHDVEQQIVMDSDSDRKKRPIKASKRAAAAPKKSNASSPISTIDKESRARARERARERTKERSRLRWATLASSISIEEAPPPPPPPPPSSRHLNMASQVEDVIPAFEHSSYCHQDQWELSGVVFAKAHFH